MNKIENITLVHSFDFSRGKQISSGDIARWHQEVLNTVKNGAKSHAISSGNSIVIAFRLEESDEIVVYEVTNGFIEYNYDKEAK